MRVKSNLKALLDERDTSIQQFSRDSGLKLETLRRLYNDDTKQFQRDTIGRVCEVLNVGIAELLLLTDEKDPEE